MSKAMENNMGRRAAYVHGSTATKLDIDRELQSASRREFINENRRRKEKAQYMSVGYVLFLTVALVFAGVVLVKYIQVQTELTNVVKVISNQEIELNNLRVKNEENYSRIISSVDMEEVKRVAIGELGMVYPKEGQVIFYTNEGNDYVRKVETEN